jgi:hypothetical protein
MSNASKSPGIPDNILSLLSAADERNGFPTGTMRSVMQQEVGSNSSKYLSDPTAYHYGLNAAGKRVAGHTGNISTAFGPFGILESTGARPGYGVAPLASKDIGEQVRFASDYLAARSKGVGLEAGLAGYGEGTKYAKQVMGRIGGPGPQVAAPAANPGPVGVAPPMVAQAAPQQVAQAQVAPPEFQSALGQQMAQAPLPQQVGDANAWQTFLRNLPEARQPVTAAELSAYSPTPQGSGMVSRQDPPAQMPVRRPDFSAFSDWSASPQRANLLRGILPDLPGRVNL